VEVSKVVVYLVLAVVHLPKFLVGIVVGIISRRTVPISRVLVEVLLLVKLLWVRKRLLSVPTAVKCMWEESLDAGRKLGTSSRLAVVCGRVKANVLFVMMMKRSTMTSALVRGLAMPED
jgi:hypothetical protein